MKTVGSESPPSKKDSRPTRRPSILERTVDSSLVLYDPATDQVYILNETAAAIWALCSGEHGRLEIAAKIASSLSLGEGEVAPEVETAIESFRASRLLLP